MLRVTILRVDCSLKSLPDVTVSLGDSKKTAASTVVHHVSCASTKAPFLMHNETKEFLLAGVGENWQLTINVHRSLKALVLQMSTVKTMCFEEQVLSDALFPLGTEATLKICLELSRSASPLQDALAGLDQLFATSSSASSAHNSINALRKTKRNSSVSELEEADRQVGDVHYNGVEVTEKNQQRSPVVVVVVVVVVVDDDDDDAEDGDRFEGYAEEAMYLMSQSSYYEPDAPRMNEEGYGSSAALYIDTAEVVVGNDDDDDDDDVVERKEGDFSPADHLHLTAGYGYNRRWQELEEDLRRLLSKEKASKDLVEVNEGIIDLSLDFVACARTYAAVIIREMHLPASQKSIKPLQVGGVIGGTKFMVEGIFFKLACEGSGTIFDSDADVVFDPSAKVAGHELKNTTVLHNINDSQMGLSLPFICLIDYMGQRVIAMAAIDVGKQTLAMGSCDAGRTVHMSDSALIEASRVAAQRLNLAPHEVAGKTVLFAGDVEGHHTPTDDRRYLLDLSRLMPPQVPNRAFRGAHLYQLLRPELVVQSAQPLCADAYSSFLRDRDTRRQFNADVKQATLLLRNIVAPEVALGLDRMHMGAKNCQSFLTVRHLKMVNHFVAANGCNKRMLGFIKRFVKVRLTRQLLSIEICARTLKQLVRREWRKCLRTSTRMTPIHRKLIDMFNATFSTWTLSESKVSEEMWQKFSDHAYLYFQKTGLSQGGTLLRKEVEANPGGMKLLFHRASEMLALSWSDRISVVLRPPPPPSPLATKSSSTSRLSKIFKSSTNAIAAEATAAALSPFDEICKSLEPFHYSDLLEVTPRLKYMNLKSHALGFRSKRNAGNVFGENKIHYLREARGHFEEALVNNPSSAPTLRNLADVSFRLFVLTNPEADLYESYMQNSSVRHLDTLYRLALQSKPDDPHTLMQRARFLEAVKIPGISKIIQLYGAALGVHPTFRPAYVALRAVLKLLDQETSAHYSAKLQAWFKAC